jgi:hypothetical protein
MLESSFRSCPWSAPFPDLLGSSWGPASVPGSPAALSTGSALLGALSKTGPFAYRSREDGLSRVLLTETCRSKTIRGGPEKASLLFPYETRRDRLDKFVNKDIIVDEQEPEG